MTNITSNAAYVIKKINDIWKEKPGKKTLQKIVFLIEQKDINLGYNYGLHFYGPYSGTLDEATSSLSADGIIEFDYSGYSHLMSVNEDDFSITSKGLTKDQEKEIESLIKRFKGKTPSELELLTTAIYTYNHLDDKSEENIIKGVQKIKGSKYPKELIQQSLENFEYFNRLISS